MIETPKREGAHEEMIERQEQRLAGLLNAPLRGPRGLAKLAQMQRADWGGKPYSPDWQRINGVMRPPRKLL